MKYKVKKIKGLFGTRWYMINGILYMRYSLGLFCGLMGFILGLLI